MALQLCAAEQSLLRPRLFTDCRQRLAASLEISNTVDGADSIDSKHMRTENNHFLSGTADGLIREGNCNIELAAGVFMEELSASRVSSNFLRAPT
jgi:hypothetical protein